MHLLIRGLLLSMALLFAAAVFIVYNEDLHHSEELYDFDGIILLDPNYSLKGIRLRLDPTGRGAESRPSYITTTDANATSMVTSYKFTNIQKGYYILTPESKDVDWRDVPRSVRVPTGIVFLGGKVKQSAVSGFRFEVFDLLTKEQLADFRHALFERGNGESYDPSEYGDLIHLPDVPIFWYICKEGYQIASGTDADIQGSGKIKNISVNLEPGFGALIQVLHHNAGAPIENADIIIDGELAGKTDRWGRYLFNSSRPARELRIQYLDWVASPLRDGHPYHERFHTLSKFKINVYLGPPEK